MRQFGVVLVASCVAASPAWAADKPVIGPAPAWVKPEKVPPVPAETDGAAVRVLLSDQQVKLERGRRTVYSDVALQIETPQGLAAGNISFPWNPDTDTLTVHKLLIRRGGEVIDVLASGQTFTVMRREQNLESATLDGVLTANIQPEGLQVGDVIQFAVSVASADPVMKGHVEQMTGTWNPVPINRAHLRVQWPASLPVRFRAAESLPRLNAVKSGDTMTIALALDDVKPLVLPNLAPARYRIGRLVELTDFASWADLAALMAPLYQKAATLPAGGKLQAELDRIRGLSADPKARAEAALALVQDKVRYVALTMGTGGLVPADAETTWARRYGDCKGKTALLLALLHGLGIEAQPVAVSTFFGDGLDRHLPMVALFNHVLVRAVIGGRTYWLDGTRTGDTGLDRLRVPDFGWGLPLVAHNAALVRMLPKPLTKPTQDASIRIDATAGITIPAPTTAETIFRGDSAITLHAGFASLAGEAKDRALRDYWRGEYDFIDVTSADANFDPDTGELRLTMKGLATMDWSNGWYRADGTDVGYRADFHREPGPDKDAPFAVTYPYYTRNRETIVLPPGFSPSDMGHGVDVDETVAGIAYRRRARLEGNVFEVEESERSVVPEFPAEDAAAAQERLRLLADRPVFIRRPDGYRPTKREIAALLESPPSTADEFLRRGRALLNQDRYDDAIADFDQAIARDPKNVWALAGRGFARVCKRDYEAAATDLDAAAKLDSRNPMMLRARGLMAEFKDEPAAAVAAYTAALETDPGSSFALGHRARVNHMAGNDAAALQDAAAALRISPHWTDLRLLRASIFKSRHEAERAVAEADALAAADPDDSYAQVAAANIYAAEDRTEEAMHAYDRALAIKPEAFIYLNRSNNRPKSDLAGRRADIDAALRFADAPVNVRVEALRAKGRLLTENGDLPGAIEAYSAALDLVPAHVFALIERGTAYLKMGKPAQAARDFDKALSKDTKVKMSGEARAAAANNICWAKATAGVLLDSALADCDLALTTSPDMAYYLDSRGLVLLRLGRFDEAIAAYDRALAGQPDLAGSLFGRAVAKAHKGDRAGAAADRAAALKADPEIEAEFKGYGVVLRP